MLQSQPLFQNVIAVNTLLFQKWNWLSNFDDALINTKTMYFVSHIKKLALLICHKIGS